MSGARMRFSREIYIWLAINLLLPVIVFSIQINNASIHHNYALIWAFSLLLVSLNVYRMLRAPGHAWLYGLAIILNHVAVFTIGDYAFVIMLWHLPALAG